MLEAASPYGGNADFSRKKSLVRPERRHINPDDPDYHYRRHAQKMNVMPSTTGVDPQMEDDHATATSEATTIKHEATATVSAIDEKRPHRSQTRKDGPNKLTRKTTVHEVEKQVDEERRRKIQEISGTPTLWNTYCHLVTFWCPNAVLRFFGKKQKESQRAWREKMGLLSLIALVMLFVGFLTFGFTETVCPNGGPLRLRVNHVGPGFMIFHGQAFDLTTSHHPLARGIPQGGNVLWDMDVPQGGKDGSFLFQNVNGACKDIITLAEGSDIPTNSKGELAWYFPCQTYNQDGSDYKTNETATPYLGYMCHLSSEARNDFYSLDSSGDVYFTWDDLANKTRNLIVYSGDVLFIWARVLQGIGPSICLPNGLALLGSLYEPGPRKNIAFAIFGGCAPTGAVMGFIFSGLFAKAWWPCNASLHIAMSFGIAG